jgi:hypothetical protein
MGVGKQGRVNAQIALIAAVVLVGLSHPAAASAAQTIGQTAPGSSCTAGESYTAGVLTSGNSYSPTASGVITSWSSFAGSVANAEMKLLVLKPNPSAGGPTHFIATQKDQVRVLTQANALNTFSGMHLPIDAGDQLGLFLQAPSGADCFFDVASADTGLFFTGGDPPLSQDSDFTGSNSSRRLNASAIVEPDADRDGFGDETQDACPTSAATQGACRVVKKCKKKKHKAHSTAQTAKKKKCRKKRHHSN